MRISVIIPAYNCKPYIRRCIESVRWQTHTDWECIIIDDGSADGTYEEIRELVGKDDRFRTIQHKDGSEGVGFSRNEGVFWAQSNAIFFLDADDWMEREMLSYLEELHYRYPSVPRIFTSPIVHRESDGSVYTWGIQPTGLHTSFSPCLFASNSCDPGHVTGNLYLLDNIKGAFSLPEKVRVIEDLLFNIGLIFAGNSVLIADKHYYHYIRRAGSLVTSYPFSIEDAEEATNTLTALKEKYNPPYDVYVRCRDFVNSRIISQLSKFK